MAGDQQRVERALARVREGDAQAYEVVWRQTTPGLVRYLAITGPVGGEPRSADVVARIWAAANPRLRHLRGSRAALVALLVQLSGPASADAGSGPVTVAGEPAGHGPSAPSTRSASTPRQPGHSTAEAIRRVRSLGPQAAQMIALRVVLGLSATEAAELVGGRAGAVRVAVCQGLRQAGGSAALDPWRLDRWLDTCPEDTAGAAVTAQLAGVDEHTAQLVQALRAPATEDELTGLAAGVRAFERTRSVGVLALLALLGRELGSVRAALGGKALGGKAAMVAAGSALLAAPALVGLVLLVDARAAASAGAVVAEQSATPYPLLAAAATAAPKPLQPNGTHLTVSVPHPVATPTSTPRHQASPAGGPQRSSHRAGRPAAHHVVRHQATRKPAAQHLATQHQAAQHKSARRPAVEHPAARHHTAHRHGRRLQPRQAHHDDWRGGAGHHDPGHRDPGHREAGHRDPGHREAGHHRWR